MEFYIGDALRESFHMVDLRSTVHIQDFSPNLACDESVYFTYEMLESPLLSNNDISMRFLKIKSSKYINTL